MYIIMLIESKRNGMMANHRPTYFIYSRGGSYVDAFHIWNHPITLNRVACGSASSQRIKNKLFIFYLEVLIFISPRFYMMMIPPPRLLWNTSRLSDERGQSHTKPHLPRFQSDNYPTVFWLVRVADL
jgi:hypothetical protein